MNKEDINMKRIVKMLIIGLLVLLPIKSMYCEKCNHYHIDGKCVEETCECYDYEINPNSLGEFPED